jgi:uncharacterized protein (TIGR00297 family)
MVDWGIGLIGSLCIAGLAYRKRSLSRTGFVSAVVLGTLLYVLGSLAWFGTLIAFFVSSTVLSKYKQRRKEAAESGYAKSGRRDAAQVAANGGLGLLLCMANVIWPQPYWWAAYVGVMATVNADTWATEIGGLSKGKPRSIVTGKPVPSGTSGGITGLGLAASAAGGLFIGIVAWVFIQLGASLLEGRSAAVTGFLPLALLGLSSGFIGALTDSWLGATRQVMYRCVVCGKEVEKPQHCQRPADRIRGSPAMTNDAVNMLSSIVGGAAAVILGFLL